MLQSGGVLKWSYAYFARHDDDDEVDHPFSGPDRPEIDARLCVPA